MIGKIYSWSVTSLINLIHLCIIFEQEDLYRIRSKRDKIWQSVSKNQFNNSAIQQCSNLL